MTSICGGKSQETNTSRALRLKGKPQIRGPVGRKQVEKSWDGGFSAALRRKIIIKVYPKRLGRAGKVPAAPARGTKLGFPASMYTSQVLEQEPVTTVLARWAQEAAGT